MSKHANRNYKDKLFRMVFREKKELLSLYNAVNQSHYTNPEELKIVTLENAIYMSMKNDLAFLIGSSLNLYEHQSTVNPNLPLRDLFYVAQEYQKLTTKQSFYSSRLILLPNPKFVVFYNGVQSQPERIILKLSDTYQKPAGRENEVFEPELELKVTLLNINPGNNTELLNACQTLREYTQYVEQVRNYADTLPLDEAVDCAINECIHKDILKDFLIKYKAEVKAMSIFEYDEEKELALYRQAEREVAMEELRPVVKAQVKAEIEAEVRAEVKSKIEAEVKEEVKAEIEAEVKEEVKAEIEAEVKEEVKAEIEAEVKKEVKAAALKALVTTLKPFLPDSEAVYKAVAANKEYADVTLDEVCKCYR